MEVLGDYSTEIRGNLLNYLALSLNMSVKVKYKDLSSQLDEWFAEFYGDKTSQFRVEIESQG
jgi:hypothetical protein